MGSLGVMRSETGDITEGSPWMSGLEGCVNVFGFCHDSHGQALGALKLEAGEGHCWIWAHSFIQQTKNQAICMLLVHLFVFF